MRATPCEHCNIATEHWPGPFTSFQLYACLFCVQVMIMARMVLACVVMRETGLPEGEVPRGTC